MIKQEILKIWIKHCASLWEYFRDIEDGEALYQSVEALLFDAIVLRTVTDMDNSTRPSLYIIFTRPSNSKRQSCKVQKQGNIFCESTQIAISENEKFAVSKIDPIGVMMDGTPYIEVEISSDRFFLQPFDDSFRLVAVR